MHTKQPLSPEEYEQLKKTWTNAKTRYRAEPLMPRLFAMVDRLLASSKTPKPEVAAEPAPKSVEELEALAQEDLEEMTVKELKALAKADGIEIPKGARKGQIIDALMSV